MGKVRELNEFSDLSQSENNFSRDLWNTWTTSNTLRSNDGLEFEHCFERIAASEYLSNIFFERPRFVQKEIVHESVQSMADDSIETYVKLRSNLPNPYRPSANIVDDFYMDLHTLGTTDKSVNADDIISQIVQFGEFQDNTPNVGRYTHNCIVAVALMHQYSIPLIMAAMREWREKSTSIEIHPFAEFVEKLANSDLPLEWTAATIQCDN